MYEKYVSKFESKSVCAFQKSPEYFCINLWHLFFTIKGKIQILSPPKVDFTNLSCWKFLQQLILEILKIPRHDGFLTIFNKEIVTKSCTHAEFVAKNMTKTYFVSFRKSFLVPCFQNSSIFKFQNNRNLQDFEQKIPQI